MAFSLVYPVQSVSYESGGTTYEAISAITLTSNGWSGSVVDASSSDLADRTFRLAIGYRTTCNGVTGTLNSEYAHVNQSAGVVGISLEHMGAITITAGVNVENQFYGAQLNTAGTATEIVNAWGATTSAMNRDARNIIVDSADYTSGSSSGTFTNQALYNLNLNLGGASKPIQHVLYPSWSAWYRFNSSLSIDTDLPIFSTDAELIAWVNDPTNPDTIAHMLNYADAPTPEEEYENRFNYFYMKNIIGKNTRNLSGRTEDSNLRWLPYSGKICLERITPTESLPYDYKLCNYENYTAYTAPYDHNSDDDYVETTNFNKYFLSKSISIGDDYYTAFNFMHNLLTFENEGDGERYANDEIDASSASNYAELKERINEQVRPPWGDEDEGNDNGINGQIYAGGNRMWVLTNSQLNAFFHDVYDTANITDILEGTLLFGSNQISAITSLIYLPIDVNDVADVYPNDNPIWLGSWQCPTAEGKYIIKNNKLIDCGSVYISPVYNSFLDLEPYMQLYIMLPYCGIHPLQLSKYYKSNMGIKYSVDVTTGSCSAHIYADGRELDTFDGTMVSNRPITAIDQSAYMGNVINAISNSSSAVSSISSAGINAGMGLATGNVSAVGKGLLEGIGGVTQQSFNNFNILQAVDNPPMSTRGGFSGCLGFFANQKIHLICAQKKTIRPKNQAEVVGFPSGQGGTVGSFSGYLQCSAFKMANGFSGTSDESNEISAIMSNGIYL